MLSLYKMLISDVGKQKRNISHPAWGISGGICYVHAPFSLSLSLSHTHTKRKGKKWKETKTENAKAWSAVFMVYEFSVACCVLTVSISECGTFNFCVTSGRGGCALLLLFCNGLNVDPVGPIPGTLFNTSILWICPVLLLVSTWVKENIRRIWYSIVSPLSAHTIDPVLTHTDDQIFATLTKFMYNLLLIKQLLVPHWPISEKNISPGYVMCAK